MILPRKALLFALVIAGTHGAECAVELPPAQTRHGYLARLLINEVPFPGERLYRSEADTAASMESILNVLNSRLHSIPGGYTQEQIASVTTTDVIDIITAGGVRGQVDGFYRNSSGQFVTVARVEERINRLVDISNSGQPGTFARIINHAVELSTIYVDSHIMPPDRYAALTVIGNTPVTGRAFSWMTAAGSYHPGGNFVAIPPGSSGVLGGNRFFSLRAKPK